MFRSIGAKLKMLFKNENRLKGQGKGKPHEKQPKNLSAKKIAKELKFMKSDLPEMEKLRLLKEKFERGIISEEMYRLQRRNIVDGD